MGSFPGWHRHKGGGKRCCDVCGAEYFINEGKLFKQRGLWVDKDCYDTLTDQDRQKRIKQ